MKALVFHPYLKRLPHGAKQGRTPQAKLDEAVRLSQAIALEIVGAELLPLPAIRPATLLGRGKVEEMQALVKEREAGLVVMDHPLSPVQQRNLEKEWGCKVIDRSALILEIFGARARTHEGKLQVELAALEYQKSRLVRSWTHLERQRGGFGFLGGPGESQIEIDRRLIRERISKIKNALAQVARTRTLHRAPRRAAPYPVVALVGYTNAGKSTLFNRLTGAEVVAEDALFATLDPTLRQMPLPSKMPALLSDTVGFISDLPHELVAAFRATLEEVMEADLLLHVRDRSHPDSDEQAADVMEVLKNLLPEATLSACLMEVWNKADMLPEPLAPMPGEPSALCVSAVTGQGIDALLVLLDARLTQQFTETLTLALPASDGKALAWLYRHGAVTVDAEENGTLHVRAQLSHASAARFHAWRAGDAT